MRPARIDDVRRLLPDLEELRPLVDRILESSRADPSRRWTGSGELDTLGSRLLHPGALREDAESAGAEAKRRIEALYGSVVAALEALAAGEPARVSAILLEVAAQEESAGRLDRAEAWARAAHGAVHESVDRGPAALALRRAARAAREQGALDRAAADYEEAHAASLAAGDRVGAVIAATGRGNVEIDRGGWGSAAAWYLKGLALLGEAPPSRERWQLCQNLSIVARRQGDLVESARWLESAAAVAAATQDPMAAAEVENGRGLWALANKDAAAAESCFRAALAAAAAPKARVTILVNLAEALLGQGRSLEAAEAGRAAEHEAIRARVLVKLPEVYRTLGRVAAATAGEDAIVFFERALELVEQWKLPDWERAETLAEYARLLDELGRTEEASAYRREAVALRREKSQTTDRSVSSSAEIDREEP